MIKTPQKLMFMQESMNKIAILDVISKQLELKSYKIDTDIQGNLKAFSNMLHFKDLGKATQQMESILQVGYYHEEKNHGNHEDDQFDVIDIAPFTTNTLGAQERPLTPNKEPVKKYKQRITLRAYKNL